MEAEELDVDDSDIRPWLLRSSPPPPRKPAPSPARRSAAGATAANGNELGVSRGGIPGLSAPSATLRHPFPVTGSSGAQDSHGSKSASSIFSRLQRPPLQACSQRPSWDVTSRVVGDPSSLTSSALSASFESPASIKRARLSAETDNYSSGTFPAHSLSTNEAAGFSDVRPCHGTFKSAFTNSHAGKGCLQQQSANAEQECPSAEACQDNSLGSQCHINMTSLPYEIPGPAGAVQVALRKRNPPGPCASTSKSKTNTAVRGSRIPIEDDSDFNTRPWINAMEYLRQNEATEIPSNISSVKSSRTENRVRKLVGIIKACTPNGCGDVFVTLKDLSGTIGGTINRNVMAETEFGRDVEPGAVILLHEVAVFSPMPHAHYLNITINNVEQVFKKEVRPPEEHGHC